MPEQKPSPSLVVDADVLVASMLNPHTSLATIPFEFIAQDKAIMLVSHALWTQYQKCLWHPDFMARKDFLTEEFIEKRLSEIADKAVAIEEVPEQIELHRSPEDEHIVNLAVYKEADFIVTRDKGLLVLNENKAWQQWYPGIKMVSPYEFTSEVSLWQERQMSQERTHDRDFGPEL